MKTFTVAAAALATVEARNLARMEAQPTVPAIFALDGFSPVPTTPPAPEHVAARADSSSPVLLYNTGNTCGYVSGVSSAPYYCINKGDYCALSTSASGRVGRIACCGASECNFRTTCVSSADIYTNKACNEECRDNIYIVKCTDALYPFCNTVSFPGGAIDYACGISDIRTYQVLQTSYSGQVNPQSYTEYTVTGSASGSSRSGSATGAPAPTRTSITSSTSSTSSGSGSGSTSQPTNENKSSKSGTPVGAIVGGVVGGVGAIALIGIGILLFLRNKKKKNIQQSPPAPLMSQPQNGGAPHPPSQYGYPPDATNAAYSTSPSAAGAYYPPQQQQGSPSPNFPYSQHSVSPVASYAPQQYGQQGFGQQPYQQAGSPPPMQQHAGSPPPMQQQHAPPAAGGVAGAAAGAAAHKGAPSGPVHEAPTANSAGHRGEMQELE
ncbi:hypothetical protein LMH87_010172 [Akanthomyces muscarius]|uniref:Uncharacterized protein n=1 Tax=Akanthomyces muscarius TaxID=2231603 RepID=A0A9W8QEG0_AKAMU|nr:hypothetical protein LMH87_010172 [Akanthomyces muscarius]KAJ4153697.1 hypothetical protein LMH87_010172 [Akanthomyces muscarius]